MTVSRELGIHHLVTKLSAELNRFGIMEGLVTSYGRNHQQNESDERDPDHPVPLFPDVKIEDGPAEGRVYFFILLPEGNKHSNRNENKAEDEKCRKDDIEINTKVSVGVPCQKREDQDDKHEQQAVYYKDYSGDTQPVVN